MTLSSAEMTGSSDARRSGGRSEHQASVQAVSRKLELLKRFTASEENRQRVSQGGDPEASGHFQRAGTALAEAAAALAADDLGAALAAADEGLRQMSLALRKAEDPDRRSRLDAVQYERLRKRVFSFSEAFQRIAQEKGDPEIYRLLDQDRLTALLTAAKSHADEGDYARAKEHMSSAAAVLERALSQARDSETLMQRLSFRTPEEEFEYELRRNESYEMLVELLESGRPRDSAGLRIMREVLEENAVTRERARARFAGGDLAAAIDMLEQSSERVSRALRMSGLAF